MAGQDSAAIFDKICEKVRKLDPVNTRKWFDDLVLAQFDGGLLQIGCPDETKAQYLEDTCQSVFSQAAQSITGHLVGVEFTVADRKPQPQQKSRKVEAGENVKLHPDYTFENFVVGPCNRLAHASCIAVSNSPGNTYNPLFLYGTVGLGKTHLQHALCHEARNREPNTRIRFLSCEQFVNKFISAIEAGNLLDFQTELRSVDILVIDDIQFLREREQSQEEFFHTFNALYNNRKQIVLTADCAPGELPAIEDRLISRFKWGLVCRMDPPSYETRVAIVQKKAHLRGLDIGDDIAEFIADKVKANIRELEGALTIIYATAQTTDEPITLDLARQALGDTVSTVEKNITISDIIGVVTDHFSVRLSDLQSKKRSQSIALPRQICMYLARNMTRHSLEEIGGHLGGRDHTTVLHACNKITELEKNDQNMRNQLAELSKVIKKG
ncbi:Chromosomal replication initiator protein DnaA [Anaerohalosphaera lusitana]|uniref:Chromosomal replication initiator protein DnaA n=1 Tax=Anaerohalosphaera lusitana TaxID=1936003 RepID=A0A1U9NHP4_9BACT|nr:chromosomal replication initiator protein DnaA [Anaerohalosphaera lusitana]AQT67278.1 Chromosomal replication initiator protein DnaA [Anaerohalosphaera lusitana]